MRNIPELVTDARLERLASAHGRASAEAYVLLELREARSAGHNVFAFQSDGRYAIRSIANEHLKRHPSTARDSRHG
jgi:hypothetical protein